MRPGDLLAARASLIAVWLVLRVTMDSGSSKGGGATSYSRPLGPSGEPWTELLLVVSCVVCGDMMGETCCEPEVAEEALAAEAGMEDEGMVGRELVCSCDGFARRDGRSWGDAAAIVYGELVGGAEEEVFVGIRCGELGDVVMLVRG